MNIWWCVGPSSTTNHRVSTSNTIPTGWKCTAWKSSSGFRLRDLEIVDAQVGFETHPFDTCPTITESYRNLIGLNVARGFNRQVRELFGGPRGCTHTTALLQAMAPAVHQSMWSVSIKLRRLGVLGELPPEDAETQRQRALQANLNTCHVWDEDGTRVELMRAGNDDNHLPDSIRKRLEALGVDEERWR